MTFNVLDYKLLILLVGLFCAIVMIGTFALLPTSSKIIYNLISMILKYGIIVFQVLFFVAMLGLKTTAKIICLIYGIITSIFGGWFLFGNIDNIINMGLSGFETGVNKSLEGISKGLTSVDPSINDFHDKMIQIASKIETNSSIVENRI